MDLEIAPALAPLPALTYASWRDTRDTLHLLTQIVGKIRLALMPPRNHWWHATLYLSDNGLTTGPIPYGESSFEIDFDLHRHYLNIATPDARRGFDLRQKSVRSFYYATLATLHDLGIEVSIRPQPYECHSTIPFADDEQHRSYDARAVADFWRVLLWTHGVFWEFNSEFYGKLSPIQLFWHSFDLAVTRFSGRAAPLAQGNRVNREAYSHEVVSFGFWPGDASFPEAAYYSYTYPEPPPLRRQALDPPQAFWTDRNGSALAILRYADVRAADNARAHLLTFLHSAYRAGAKLAHWDAALTQQST